LEARREHPALRDGFHDDEGTHRWTNGRALLPMDWLRCRTGALALEVQLASHGLKYVVFGGANVSAVVA
jgi:hypothetical protein